MGITGCLEEFFSDTDFRDDPAVKALFVLTRDGQMAYRYPIFENDVSVGALVVGSWQAVMAVSDFMDEGVEEEDFRLSFDTSDTGIYVLPLCRGEGDFYVGILYEGHINPAQLKNRLRVLRDGLGSYLDRIRTLKVGKKSVLFDDITDEEIDQLFSDAGN